jgi:Asp-tRNA(Asn)/Glu-tRNA(Gln) amidotransferase B subunit
VLIEDAFIEEVRQKLTELPDKRKKRFKDQYGLNDDACGTLVDRKDQECGDFEYNTKTLADQELMVVDIISTHDDKKALYDNIDDAKHVKWLLEQENPDVSYTLVSFTKCVYEFYKFDTVE